MASQLAAALPAAVPDASQAGVHRTPLTRLVKHLVRRRVALTLVLFTSLVLLDMLVIDHRPRDIFDSADPLVTVSELLILAGLSVRSWAAGTLRKRRELATSGPYAWTRNPLYAGSFLMMVGFCTLVGDPWSLWCAIGPVAELYWLAIRSEERHLQRIFPDQWPQYTAAVPRLVPRQLIWPRATDWSLAQWQHNAEYKAWLGSAIALAGIKLWQLWL